MDRPYRACVVAVLTKDYRTFLVGERKNIHGAWQFPQGGIEDGEAPEVAVIRELCEETGIDEVEIECASSDWISYDFPESFGHAIAQKYRGQSQRWFLLKLAEGASPDLSKSDGEFRDLDWRSLDVIVDGIVDWKKDSYIRGLKSLGLEVKEDV